METKSGENNKNTTCFIFFELCVQKISIKNYNEWKFIWYYLSNNETAAQSIIISVHRFNLFKMAQHFRSFLDWVLPFQIVLNSQYRPMLLDERPLRIAVCTRPMFPHWGPYSINVTYYKAFYGFFATVATGCNRVHCHWYDFPGWVDPMT